MSEQKIYSAPNIDIDSLSQTIMDRFRLDNYETQKFKGPNEAAIVQLRQKGSWRSVLGMSSALTITLSKQDENLIVDIGAAKWGEKAAVGAVGAVIFFPALITAAYGAWKQSQLPDQVFDLIQQQIQLSQGQEKQEMPASGDSAKCPSCKQAITLNSKFCPACGAALKLKCPSCSADIGPGSKFCGNCGAKL